MIFLFDNKQENLTYFYDHINLITKKKTEFYLRKHVLWDEIGSNEDLFFFNIGIQDLI
jgi:hypothetical protein